MSAGTVRVRGDDAVRVGPGARALYLIDRARFGNVTIESPTLDEVVVDNPRGAENLSEFVRNLPATVTSLWMTNVGGVDVPEFAVPRTVTSIVFEKWTTAARVPARLSAERIDSLNILRCPLLTELPDLGGVGSLGVLVVNDMPLLAALPRLPERLSCLFMRDCAKVNFSGGPLPADPGRFVLSLCSCPELRRLPAVRTQVCDLTLVELPSLETLEGLEGVGVYDRISIASTPALRFRPGDHLRVRRASTVRLDQSNDAPVEGADRFVNIDHASVHRYLELVPEPPGAPYGGTKVLVGRAAERDLHHDLEWAEAMRRAGLPADAAWIALVFRGPQ